MSDDYVKTMYEIQNKSIDYHANRNNLSVVKFMYICEQMRKTHKILQNHQRIKEMINNNKIIFPSICNYNSMTIKFCGKPNNLILIFRKDNYFHFVFTILNTKVYKSYFTSRIDVIIENIEKCI